ncbi:hypothetical protein Tco_0782224 [Tanacetum coccineum]
MSSPSHPTSNIEDAFSSNFLDFILASSNYVPALPGKTYSSSSNNSFGLVPIALPTLSLFHDDPFMKDVNTESHSHGSGCHQETSSDECSTARKFKRNMANTDNTTKPREAMSHRLSVGYKEFMSCQPINFKGMEGTIGLIR